MYVIGKLIIIFFFVLKLLSFVDSSGGCNFPEKCSAIFYKMYVTILLIRKIVSFVSHSICLAPCIFIMTLVSKMAFYLLLLWIEVQFK